MTGSARCRAHHYHDQFAEQQARERLRAQRQQQSPHADETAAGTAASDNSTEQIEQKHAPEIDTDETPE